MEAKNLKKGQEVYFVGEKIPMTVNRISKNYAICTRNLHRREDADILKHKVEMGGYCTFSEAYNDLKDSLIYSILDFKNNTKGPHNSFGHGIEKDTLYEDAKEVLDDLESGEIEMSRRNSCKLNINWELTA